MSAPRSVGPAPPVTPEQARKLAIAACDVLLAVSDETWKRPRSFMHGIPRSRLDELAAALDGAYPGFHERARELVRARRAER